MYACPDCKDCWARLYCAGGCAANALHATGDIHGTYEYGCKVFRKRMECALMLQVAQRLDPELAKNAGMDEKALEEARKLHSTAHISWEYWTAVNGAWFHNPDQAVRSLAKSAKAAQDATAILRKAMADKQQKK